MSYVCVVCVWKPVVWVGPVYKRGTVLNLGAPSSIREAAVVRPNKELTVHLPDFCHYITEHYCKACSCVCVGPWLVLTTTSE